MMAETPRELSKVSTTKKSIGQKRDQRKMTLENKLQQYSEMCGADVCLGIRIRDSGESTDMLAEIKRAISPCHTDSVPTCPSDHRLAISVARCPIILLSILVQDGAGLFTSRGMGWGTWYKSVIFW
jgi:hypothetical protein